MFQHEEANEAAERGKKEKRGQPVNPPSSSDMFLVNNLSTANHGMAMVDGDALSGGRIDVPAFGIDGGYDDDDDNSQG